MFENLTNAQFWGISVGISVSLGIAAAAAYQLYRKIVRWRRDKAIEEDIKEYKRRKANGESHGFEVGVYKYKDRETWQKVCDRFRSEGLTIIKLEAREFPENPADNVYCVSVVADGNEESHRVISEMMRDDVEL